MADTVHTELKLTEQIKSLVNNALEHGKPMLVCYVTEDGKPSLSFRGSTQVYSPTQLAIWVRNPKGGLPTAIAKHPDVIAFYSEEIRNPAVRAMITFKGRAHIDTSEAARRAVYDNSHVLEREKDPNRAGAALIIDLDSVAGMAPGSQFRMTRAA